MSPQSSVSSVYSRPLVALPIDIFASTRSAVTGPLHSSSMSPAAPSTFVRHGSNATPYSSQSIIASRTSPSATQLNSPFAAHSKHQSNRLALFSYPSSKPESPDPVFSHVTGQATRQRATHACDSCKARKTKVRSHVGHGTWYADEYVCVQCSGTNPTCERCVARGLVCRYAPLPDRNAKIRNPSQFPRSRNTLSKPSVASKQHNLNVRPETGLSMSTMYSLPAAEPVSMVSSGLSLSPFNQRVPEKWVPSPCIMAYGSHDWRESESSLGLTGVYSKPASTVTTVPLPVLDITPTTLSSMFNQTMTSPQAPKTYSTNQSLTWDRQNYPNDRYVHSKLPYDFVLKYEPVTTASHSTRRREIQYQ